MVASSRHALKRTHGSRHRARRLFLEQLERRCLLTAEFGATFVADHDLLYIGIDDAATSSTNSGLLSFADVDTGLLVPLRAGLRSMEKDSADWPLIPRARYGAQLQMGPDQPANWSASIR